MRKIIVSMMLSADGFFAGLKGEVDWHVVDEEFNKYAISLLNSIDTIFLGRVTYQLFESYWPSALTNPKTSKTDLEIARKIDDATKIVFSNTLKKVEWKNSKILKEITIETISKLKKQPGKDIVIYGSGTIVSILTKLRLIDEYRLIVNPIVLGSGKSLFKGISDRLHLRLMKTKIFGSGNVLLQYEAV